MKSLDAGTGNKSIELDRERGDETSRLAPNVSWHCSFENRTPDVTGDVVAGMKASVRNSINGNTNTKPNTDCIIATGIRCIVVQFFRFYLCSVQDSDYLNVLVFFSGFVFLSVVLLLLLLLLVLWIACLFFVFVVVVVVVAVVVVSRCDGLVLFALTRLRKKNTTTTPPWK